MLQILSDPATRGVSIAAIVLTILAFVVGVVALTMMTTDPTRGIVEGQGIHIDGDTIQLASQPAGTLLGVSTAGIAAIPTPIGPFGPGSLIQGGQDGGIVELPVGAPGGVLTVDSGICTWIRGPKTAVLTAPTAATGVFGNGIIAPDVTITLRMGAMNERELETLVPVTVTYAWLSDGSSGASLVGTVTIPLDSIIPSTYSIVSGTSGYILATTGVVAVGSGPPATSVLGSSSANGMSVEMQVVLGSALVAGQSFSLTAMGTLTLKQL